MSAFDQGWAVVKMPFHGTSLSRANKIMQEGLKPRQSEQYDRWYGSPVSFSTPDYDAALDYAASAMDREDPPVVIHIPDEVPFDHQEQNAVNVYENTIPPELLSIMYQGPPSNEGEGYLDYRDRMNALMDTEYKRWLEDEEDDRI
mgnify:FL=1